MAFEDKSPEVRAFLNCMASAAYGNTVDEAHAKKTYIVCKDPATVFNNENSRIEYGISGMCQQCQDEVFGI